MIEAIRYPDNCVCLRVNFSTGYLAGSSGTMLAWEKSASGDWNQLKSTCLGGGGGTLFGVILQKSCLHGKNTEFWPLIELYQQYEREFERLEQPFSSYSFSLPRIWKMIWIDFNQLKLKSDLSWLVNQSLTQFTSTPWWKQNGFKWLAS